MQNILAVTDEDKEIVEYYLGKTIEFQVEVFWVVTPCSFVIGFSEDGVSKVLRNVDIPSHHYTVSLL
jgi:hypothetical protein